MRHQMCFYLNDDKRKDYFIIEHLKKEKNISGLIQNLLYDHYTSIKTLDKKLMSN